MAFLSACAPAPVAERSEPVSTAPIAQSDADPTQRSSNAAITVTPVGPFRSTELAPVATGATHVLKDGSVGDKYAARELRPDANRPLRRLHENELLHHSIHAADHVVTLNPGWMVAHFIDVGQGDSTLLEFSCGAVLIDAGGEQTNDVHGGTALAEYLDNFFLRRQDLNNTLDLVVITHPHKDHALGVVEDETYDDDSGQIGAPGLVDQDGHSKYVVLNLVDNGLKKPMHNNKRKSFSGLTQQNRLREFAIQNDAGYESVFNEEIRYADGLTSDIIDPIDCEDVDPVLRVLWGQRHPSHRETRWNANNDSVVLRLDFGESSFLFTGDLQEKSIDEMIDSYQEWPATLDVDIYQVGHHGSHNGTTPNLMRSMTPRIAVISMGDPGGSREDWTGYVYGHPRDEAVEVLIDSQYGVSDARDPYLFQVGVAQRKFEWWEIDRAVYATGWEGNIVISANEDGELFVDTEF